MRSSGRAFRHTLPRKPFGANFRTNDPDGTYAKNCSWIQKGFKDKPRSSCSEARNSDQSTKLAEYGRVIKIHFLAYQIASLKDEDEDTLHLHLFSSRCDSCPNTALRASKLGLHNHRVVRIGAKLAAGPTPRHRQG